jgi:hypothetical protein
MLSVALRNFAARLAVTTVLSFFQPPGAARAADMMVTGDYTHFGSLQPYMTGTIQVE